MLVEKALMIAKNAHNGQVDKAGKPYITHPEYVASLVETQEEKAAALLHDVLEDTAVTVQELACAGIPKVVIGAVCAISKEPGESYGVYLARVKANPIARKVKIADLKHNMDLSRLPKITSADIARERKYTQALAYLQN
ncbi:MAG: HD domain-containing protein [Oscillospiraceae bacterium]